MPGEGPLESQCHHETNSDETPSPHGPAQVFKMQTSAGQKWKKEKEKKTETQRQTEEGGRKRKRKGTDLWGLALLSVLEARGAPARLFLPRVLAR